LLVSSFFLVIGGDRFPLCRESLLVLRFCYPFFLEILITNFTKAGISRRILGVARSFSVSMVFSEDKFRVLFRRVLSRDTRTKERDSPPVNSIYPDPSLPASPSFYGFLDQRMQDPWYFWRLDLLRFVPPPLFLERLFPHHLQALFSNPFRDILFLAWLGYFFLVFRLFLTEISPRF